MRMTVGKDLVALRAAARDQIDIRAGALRTLFFISAPGQEAEYHIKEAEAQRFKNDPDVATKTESQLNDEYPLLSSEARVDLNGRDVAADTIQQQAVVWKVALAVINEMRRGRKRALDTTTTVAGIDALVAGMTAEELFTLAPGLEAATG